MPVFGYANQLSFPHFRFLARMEAKNATTLVMRVVALPA
jgi:hypothetical protein